MRKRDAFTLVELLVVISVVALLMSLLVPSLEKARKQARQLACRNNLKQIGMAACLYAEDNEEYIPRGGETGTWFQLFMPFLGNEVEKAKGDYRNVKIYRCPSFPRNGVDYLGVPFREQTVCFVVSSWTFKDRDDMVGEEVWEPTKLSQFDRPASTIYMAENEAGPWRAVITNEDHPDLMRYDVWSPSHLPNSDSTDVTLGRRVARDRHRGGGNTLWLDWHVEWVASEDMTVYMWKDRKR